MQSAEASPYTEWRRSRSLHKYSIVIILLSSVFFKVQYVIFLAIKYMGSGPAENESGGQVP